MSQDLQGTVLRVNFDAALVRLLREVRYFLLLPELPIEIPANALKVRCCFKGPATSLLITFLSLYICMQSQSVSSLLHLLS